MAYRFCHFSVIVPCVLTFSTRIRNIIREHNRGDFLSKLKLFLTFESLHSILLTSIICKLLQFPVVSL